MDNNKTKENSTTSLNDSIVIKDEPNQSTMKDVNSEGLSEGDTLKGASVTVDDPTEGVTDRDDHSETMTRILTLTQKIKKTKNS